MKKTLMVSLPSILLLTLSAEAKVLPIQSYNVLTEQFSLLNTCRAEGYIVDTALNTRMPPVPQPASPRQWSRNITIERIWTY